MITHVRSEGIVSSFHRFIVSSFQKATKNCRVSYDPYFQKYHDSCIECNNSPEVKNCRASPASSWRSSGGGILVALSAEGDAEAMLSKDLHCHWLSISENLYQLEREENLHKGERQLLLLLGNHHYIRLRRKYVSWDLYDLNCQAGQISITLGWSTGW